MIEEGETIPRTGPWKIWRAAVGPWIDWDLSHHEWDRRYLGKPYHNAPIGLVQIAIPEHVDFFQIDEGGVV